MPSKPAKTTHRSNKSTHQVFLPLLVLSLFFWFFYRLVFHFPVWFDETIGKFVFFALPVVLYVAITANRQILASFALDKVQKGLLIGLAIGGLFGFTGVFLGALSNGGQVVSTPYYLANWFWWEFFLALLTGFWETLFFFSFVMTVVLEKYKQWSALRQMFFVSLIFLVFHLPNIFARFTSVAVLWQIILLFAFALGQALLFYNRRNAYVLVLNQAIWGMVLLINF